MPDINTSHQGTLRGSVTLPVEPTSGVEAGKTAPSDMDRKNSDASGTLPEHSQHGSENDHGEDDIEIEELPDDYEEQQTTRPPKANIRKKTAKDSPAYVAPIPPIPKIPSVQPLRSETQPTPPPDNPTTPSKKQPVYEASKDHLVGKKIDEYGDIVDDEGNVLGRVEGDLPSMMGRKISNARGDVLADDGELLGYVAAIGAGEGAQRPSKKEVPTWSLTEVMKAMAAAGKGPGGLRVDPFGNILDAEGNTVGSFHDNISGFGKKAAEFAQTGADGETEEGTGRPQKCVSGEAPQKTGPEENSAGAPSRPEPRENAQSHRKEDPAISPSDIFLDVKSTTEGIQLTIRIPTVFNNAGQPRQPKIVFE